MKFVVQKTKPGFFEDEYRITLPEKTKKRLRTAALVTAILGPAAVVFGASLASPKNENDPETPKSP